MSGEGHDEPTGGASGGGGPEPGGPAPRQVPNQGGPVGSDAPVGPPGVPGGGPARPSSGPAHGQAPEPAPVETAEQDPESSVPQQREGRGGAAATAPLSRVPSPAQREDTGAGEAGAEPGGDVPASDADLVQRMRDGDDSAYEELFRRHSTAVRRYARTCCRDADTADDLTAEVFARTLQAVRGGAGPEHAVRAYLLTTVRRVAANWTKSAKREHLVEDFAVFATQAAASSSVSEDETLDLGADVRAMHEAERSLAMQAFRSLPERWQAVLWHTTVEEESPSQVAPLFGLTANATAVLAGRAREGLKQAYLQAHVSSALTAGGDCARYADRLGAYARGGLRMRAERGLRKHLDECAKCRMAAGELASVNAQIPAVVPIAVIGWFATGFSLKALGVVGGATAGAAGAGAAAAAGSSSGGTSSGGAAAAADGASTPLKVGAAALAAVAAAAGLVFALTSGDGDKPPAPEAKPPAAQQLPPQIPVPSSPPTHKAPAPPAPEPKAPAPKPPAPKPTPTKRSVPPPAKPSPTPSATPTEKPPKPTKPPRPPEPTRAPTTPPPAPAVYQVNRLPYAFQGDGTEPEVRLTSAGQLWQRQNLSVAKTGYAYGASMHAPGSVTIDLNRPCSTYEASVGVDDMTLGLGKVRFSVYGDSGPLWTSPVVSGGDPAVPVSVPIAGQKSIRLVVQPASPLGAVAVADWVQARISCR
ncbi:sigma-70 family RNA polymerase sigma factor [Streptomyces tremellae]|uniref:Sigma-70 family RNA polymerase sigma factor n=1 Tax=Streptomyces tremellae TaxID=1124239 RepID=A0ABP7GER9_9ACTN